MPAAFCLISSVAQSGKLQMSATPNHLPFRNPGLPSGKITLALAVIPSHVGRRACILTGVPKNQSDVLSSPDASVIPCFCRCASRQDRRAVHSPNRWTHALCHSGWMNSIPALRGYCRRRRMCFNHFSFQKNVELPAWLRFGIPARPLLRPAEG